MRPDIISSLIIGGSDGGGGHTNDSIISSVDLIMPEPRSGGSTREDLKDLNLFSEILYKSIKNIIPHHHA